MCTNQRSAQSKSLLPNLILAAVQTNVGLAAQQEEQAKAGDAPTKNLAELRDDAEVQIEDSDTIFEHTLVIEKTEGENKTICFEELWGMTKAKDEGWSKLGLSEADAATGLLKYGTHCHDC